MDDFGGKAMAFPGDDIRVLLVARDDNLIEEVHQTCKHSPSLNLVGAIYRVDETASAVRQRRAQVVLMDLSMLGEDIEQPIMDLILKAPDVLVFVLLSQENLSRAQRALAAGARGFILRPIDPEVCHRTISRVYTLEVLKHQGEKRTDAQGEVVALVGAKGGVGRTVIAANLAIALKETSDKMVLVMEAMNVPGDLAAVFAMTPTTSLQDVLKDVRSIDLPTLIQRVPQHPSGVYVLPGTLEYGLGDGRVRDLFSLIHMFRNLFAFIIVDVGELQDPFTAIAVQEADHLLVITTPDLLSLHRTGKFITALVENAEVEPERIALVLNKYGIREGVRKEAVANLMDRPVAYTIRYDSATVDHSIYKGIPFMLEKKRNTVAEDVLLLAKDLAHKPSDGHRVSRSPLKVWNRMRHMFAFASLLSEPRG